MITETVNQRIASRVQYVKPIRFNSARGAKADLNALSIEVQPQAVTDFQSQFPEDAQLIAATAWASFAAARRAGSWLAAGVSEIRREQ
jgi:hypothetical protein